MRHLKRGRKLNRTPTHKRAMMRNLATSLFIHGRVVTTPAKAKETKPFAEKLITLAKQGTLHARRRAISLLHDPHVVASLFDNIGPRYASRPGGYSRILHLDRTRVGDSAPQVLFELVEESMESAGSGSADGGAGSAEQTLPQETTASKPEQDVAGAVVGETGADKQGDEAAEQQAAGEDEPASPPEAVTESAAGNDAQAAPEDAAASADKPDDDKEPEKSA